MSRPVSHRACFNLTRTGERSFRGSVNGMDLIAYCDFTSLRALQTVDPRASIRLRLSSIRHTIGAENPIPEEMDDREIAVRMPVLNEVQFLFPSEPCKPLQPRSLYS